MGCSRRNWGDSWGDRGYGHAFFADHVEDIMLLLDSDPEFYEPEKVVAIYRVIFHQFQNIYIQNKSGLMDKQYFEALCAELPICLNSSYEELGFRNTIRIAWEREKYNYGQGFQSFMDSMIK